MKQHPQSRSSNAEGLRRRASSRFVKRAAARLCLLALLLSLAAPFLLNGAGAQVRKSADPVREAARRKSARAKSPAARPDAQVGKPSAQSRPPARTNRPSPRVVAPARPDVRKVIPDEDASPTQTGAEPAPSQVITEPKPAQTVVDPRQTNPAPVPLAAESVRPVSSSTVSFDELAERQSRAARAAAVKGVETLNAVHPPLTIEETPRARAEGEDPNHVGKHTSRPAFVRGIEEGAPLAASPDPAASYLGQEDGPKAGTAAFIIPPDTQGAVGLDKVFVNTNQNYRVQNKTTGAPLSTVSIDTFWAASGGAGVFDPRITYDPYNQRWILAAASDSGTTNSSIILAVSQTSDPQGAYYVYRFVVGCAKGDAGCSTSGEWADFPMLGFNKNWIVVSMNMFEVNGGIPFGQSFVEGRVLALDYAAARAGTGSATLFRGDDISFCLHPVETFSPTEPALYFAQHLDSTVAAYRIATMTGTPAAPSLNFGDEKTRPGGGWEQPDGDILPQRCDPSSGDAGCPATLRGIHAGDAFIRGNAVLRNGNIYYAQTIGLPAVTGMTHTGVQWTRLDTSGNFVDGGRIEDPTATANNGGKWYAYPTLAVNRNGDMLVGFSQFSSNQFASAGYALRLASDPAGTTRDPNIYKLGEDYYHKTFGGSRNRWGDYSATLVDPSNDRDLWTLQEYAQQRVPAGKDPTAAGNANVCRWGTWWAKVEVPAGLGELIISEFRLRGPGGGGDEYVEIYNASGADLKVVTTDGSDGYALAASDGTVRFRIPNGTVIPARGHYLGVNSSGYTLGAQGDQTYTTGVNDNVGIALFRTANSANFTPANRLDAAGSNAETNALYKEGAGYPALSIGNLEHALFRDLCGRGANASGQTCPTAGSPKDTDDNASDFLFADTRGTATAAGQRLGAPGPENIHSPVQRNDRVALLLLDATKGSNDPPNRVRDFASDPANNSPFGTLSVRRRVVNNTGAPVTRLRFRVIDITTFPAPPDTADLRPRSSAPSVEGGVGDPATCPGGATPCTVTLQGTTLEQPPSQPNGGGLNSTFTLTLSTPLADGDSVNVQFLLGIRQTGNFRFLVNVEALP
jgi:hypothetical protein